MKAFFFGAGSSAGTLRGRKECPPIAKNFGAELAKRSKPPREFPAIAEVAKHLGVPLENLRLEPIWTCIDYYAKLSRVLPNAPWWSDGSGSHQLKKALLRLYGKACDDIADQLRQSGNYTLRKLLETVNRGDVIISFNYDTLVERLVRLLQPKLQLRCTTFRPDVVTFAKPHGSASWCLDLDRRRVDSMDRDGAPLTKSLEEEDVDQRREPLVLGAVPIKSELVFEVQRLYDLPVFNVIAEQWKTAVTAVCEAEKLIVVGYSFPKEDQYGRFLFQEAMRLRRRPFKVEYYELSKWKRRTGAAIKETFGNRTKLIWKGEVTPAPKRRP